jgi:hypothetical protein
MGASPTRQPLQPEATGAVMEVTKWLKPSIKSVGLCDRPPPLDFRFPPLAAAIARRRNMS